MKSTFFYHSLRRFASWRTVVFFIGLTLAFAGCKRDQNLGLELQPEGQYDPVGYTDTFRVKAFTLRGQAQRSDEAQSYLGKMHSSIFGTAASSLYFNIYFQPGTLADSGLASYDIDSVVLFLHTQNIYGEPGDPLPLEVYQLSEQIYSDSSYFSDREIPTTGALIGSATKAFPNGVDPDIGDSIRIHLDLGVGQYLIDGLVNGSYLNNTEFRSYFNGLHVKVSDAMSSSLTGAIHGLALTAGTSGIVVYMSRTVQGKTRSQRIFYPINPSTARFNHFDHDYAGSAIEAALADPSNDDDLIYVQGMCGTRAEIQIDGLYELGQRKNLAVNKATLTFKLATEQPAAFGASKRLFLLDIEHDSVESLTLDYVQNYIRHDGYFDATVPGYVFDVTSHVQEILDSADFGVNVNRGLRLHAQVPVINGNDTTQTVLQGSENIVLKIYTTDIEN